MNLDQKNKQMKVFLAGDLGEHKGKLISVLESAGMQIIMATDSNDAEEKLELADCSLHIITNVYSKFSDDQFLLAGKQNKTRDNFKIFVWQTPEMHTLEIETKQKDFIRMVRNNIYDNMIFSNQESIVMLVEDIRSIMEEEVNVDVDVQKTDIFFIYNEIDEDVVSQITDIIEDVASVEKLNIILNNNVDYAKLVAMQMKKAALTVIFFKRSVSWAMPFTQQIWKNMGGASAQSNMLLLGDSNHEQNLNAKFDVPNVTSLAVAEELAPLEIIVQFDKFKTKLN